VWRSSPDLFEGHVRESSTSCDDFPFGQSVSLEVPYAVPAINSSSQSNFVLVVDNLSATDVQTTDDSDGSDMPVAAYVYVGAQFCEDRRTTSKSGSDRPVLQFDRVTNGTMQSSIEVLQLPTYISDQNYLKAQRLMIAIMDENKKEDDPMIGYGFLPLETYCSQPDSAHDFNIELTFFMATTCTLKGRISCHRSISEKAEKQATKGTAERSVIASYFRRYDLDESGTINSSEELQQLCTNLSVRLDLPLNLGEIDAKVTGAGNMMDNQWSQDDFIDWFAEEFEVDVV